MKHLFVALLLSASLAAAAQDIPQSQVPAAAVSSFQKQFKSPADVKWEKKKEGFEAKFKIGAVKHKAKFDATGKLVQHNEDLKQADLPAAVQQKITAAYAGFKVKDPEKVEEGGKVVYKVELKKQGAPDKKVTFGADGSVISDKKD